MKSFKSFLFIIVFSLVLYACENKGLENKENNKGDIVEKTWQEEKQGELEEEEIEETDDKEEISEILNTKGETIEIRYNCPTAYQRVELEEGGFGNFLRKSKLKTYGEKVKYFDGKEKNGFGQIYDSVFLVDIGDRDLHQCADAIMLLRAEYLYEKGDFDSISFDFVSGFKAEYKMWLQGKRIKIDGNEVSYYNTGSKNDSYESFRDYMAIVMAYASTLSLEKELKSIDIDEIRVGDVFIMGGSPGHAVIVVDMAEEIRGDDKLILLAQSYMPAQETQILYNRNLDGERHGPWYSLKEIKDTGKLYTPEWTFNLDKIKSW